MKLLKLTLLILTIFFTIPSLKAEKEISLLTSSPSENEIYTAWGHTAIRILDSETGMDCVFNYGVFSFDDLTLFIYKFVKGETDYMLGVESMKSARYSAIEKNCYLYESKLNLTEEETTKLSNLLFENLKPENVYYRYNFFYDNCATRPRTMIEKACKDTLIYPEFSNKQTYREIIHERLSKMEWYAFGIDICLGSETDEKVKGINITFLPMELMEILINTKKGDETNLISRTKVLIQPTDTKENEEGNFSISPLLACTIFLLLVLIHTLFYTYKKIDDKWFDIGLFTISGILGLLVFFLAFISEHPCTNPNFNLLWLNPLHLTFAISLFFKSKIKKYINITNLILLVIAIIFWKLIPQEFNIAFLPLMIALALRGIINLKKIK